MPKKVMLGLSGGVDSAVSGWLLKQAGYVVEACFMRNWKDPNTHCTDDASLKDAEAISKHLGIPLQIIDFSNAYWDEVFQSFLDDLAKGLTPNPDILCNSQIKFKYFLDYAKAQGAQARATGHYAQLSSHAGDVTLRKGLDHNKDQTYFLYRLSQSQLQPCLFPIGHLNKPEVRKIAKKIGLAVHEKKDSTGICFIGPKKYNDFISHYLLNKPGNILSVTGEVLGTHRGIIFYTIGQRQGLGLGGSTKSTKPWYVVDKSLKDNTLIVAQGHEHPALFKEILHCHQLHWINAPLNVGEPCEAKIRYRQTPQPCQIIERSETHAKIAFQQPQRAVTPGQHIVFYQDDVCLGGGVILPQT